MKKLLLAAAGSLLWLGASAQTWVNYDKLLFVIDDTDNTAQLAAPYCCPLANYDESGYWDNVVVPAQIENGGKTYTVTSVMNEAFYLRQPTSISFPETIKTIGDEVFYGVSTLKSVVFPNSVETIGSGCFYNCSGLEEVTYGSGLKSIGGGTPANFYGVPNLVKITSYAQVPPTAQYNTIGSTSKSKCTLYVPAGTITAYQRAPFWDGYKEYLEIPAEPGPGVGVEGIEAEADEAPRYFNLQGIEVSRPERGIYIRIEGDRATRVYIAR